MKSINILNYSYTQNILQIVQVQIMQTKRKMMWGFSVTIAANIVADIDEEILVGGSLNHDVLEAIEGSRGLQ